MGSILQTKLLGFENVYERIRKYLESTKSTSKMNPLRKKFRESVLKRLKNDFSFDKRFYVIEAPTGFGKTLTNLLVASYVQEKVYEEKGFIPKIIYSLPFTSIVDQTYDVIKNVLGKEYSVGIFHHARHEISNMKRAMNQDVEVDQELLYMEMSRFWLSDVIVTTFEQVIYGLAWADKSYAFRYALIDGSIVILDEVQAIPLGLLDATRTFLETAKDAYYVLSTATYPRLVARPVHLYSMDEAYKHANELGVNLNNVEYVLEKFYDDISRRTKYSDLKDHVKEIIENKKEQIIIVLNTIRSSVELGRSIEKLARDNEYEFYYLSSLVPPKVRRERIERLKEGDKPFVLLSTQVIEAGVDVSSQVLVRDFAPYDSIVQSAGRCNRNLEIDVGEVHIRALHDDKRILLAKRVYDGLILHCTMNAISDLLRDMGTERIKKVIFERKLGEYYKRAVRRAKITEEIVTSMRNLEFMSIQEKYKIIEEEPKVQIVVIIDEVSRNLVEKALEITNMEPSISKFNSLKETLSKLAEYTINVPIHRNYMEALKDYLRPIGREDSPYAYYVDARGLLEDVECPYYDETYGLVGDYLAEGAF